MTQYKNLNEIMNDVELLINDFIIETEKLINNKIKYLNQFIENNIDLNEIHNVKDMTAILSDLADKIENSKKEINNKIMEKTLSLYINLGNIQNKSARNMQSIEKYLSERYTNWFSRVFHNKHDNIEYRKSKVILEQLKKITCTDISLLGQVERKLNNSKTSNNILDITHTLEIFNNIQNIAQVTNSEEDSSLKELITLKIFFNKDTTNIFNNIKIDINNKGNSWKEILFEENDLKIKGYLDNLVKLHYPNNRRFIAACFNLMNKSYHSIKEIAISIRNGDIDIQNGISILIVYGSLTLGVILAIDLLKNNFF